MATRSLLLAGLVPLLALLYAQYSDIAFLDLFRIKNIKRTTVFERSKYPIVMAATSAFSHMEKITTITEGLVKLGYPVLFLTGPDFEDSVTSIGATYVPVEGQWPGMMPPDKMSHFLTLSGYEVDIFAFKTIFIETIPAQHRTLQRTFKSIRDEHGQDQPLIFINDFSFGGVTPVTLGAPGIRPTAVIGIGLAPYCAASNDTFPFQSGKWPDTSPDSKRIHFEAQQERYNTWPDSETNQNLKETLESMGTTKGFKSIFDMFAHAPDILLQYGIPEFEYPRSDWRPHVRFMGAPPAVGVADRKMPEWWDDVIKAKEEGKHIVAVTSSSVIFDNNVLIIPALKALSARKDVLVIATLVTSDVEDLDLEIPGNARVAKFIPLDLALPYVDTLITNGGYGTIQQALRAGVPLIVSGVGQDKTHTGGIINYIGNGYYEAVHQVDQDGIGSAFQKILENPSYRKKAQELAREYEKYDAVRIADETIQQVLRGEYKFGE